MGDGNSQVDLFGDPFVERSEGRGRPEHVWSLANSNKVLLAFAAGRSVKQAASAIGVSVPTLRKHYSSEVAKRDSAQLRLEATRMHRLNEAAKGGSVSAEKELGRLIEKARMEELSARVANRGEPRRKVERKGKKEERRDAAQMVGGIFAPPTAPGLPN